MTVDVKRSFLSGSLWSFIGSIGHQLASFTVFIYLARILTPQTFGIVAMAIAFTEIAAILCRFGQTNAIVRLEEVHDDALSTAFWIVFGFGFVITLLLMVLSNPLSYFFGEPDLKWVLICLAPLPALSTIGAVHEALIRRQMKFHLIATRNITAMVVSGGVAIILVHFQFGVAALVWQRLAFAIVSSLVVILSTKWRPKLIFDTIESRYLFNHGKSVVFNLLSNRLSPRLTDIIVGYFLGAYTLGLLRIANQMFELILLAIIQPISEVLPAVFRHYQNDKNMLKNWYLKLSQAASIVIFPALIGMAILADELILIAFGPQWEESAMIIQVLSLQFLITPMAQFTPPTLMAIGAIVPISRLAIAKISLTAIVIIISCQYGILHVVAGLVIVHYLIAIGYFRVLSIRVPGLWPTLFTEMWPPLLSVIAMCFTLFWLNSLGFFIKMNNMYFQLITPIIVGALSYLIFFIVGDLSGLWQGTVRKIFGSIKKLRATYNS